jgi:phosphoenolpyruvate carboxylase
LIANELKQLVFDAVKCLGEQLKLIEGDDCFELIEATRQHFKLTRHQDDQFLVKSLNESYQKLSRETDQNLHKLAQSFSLMLELINACEYAYRSQQLAKKNVEINPTGQQLIFVFTSHPTEARSKNFLMIMDEIIKILQKGLDKGFDRIHSELSYLLRLAIKVELAKNKKPTVADEAEQIYHLILKPDIIEEQIKLHSKGIEVYFRCWSGGDKDGHPGVGPTEMLASLNKSRKFILEYIFDRLDLIQSQLQLIVQSHLLLQLKDFKRLVSKIKTITKGDGVRITQIKDKFKILYNLLESNNLCSPEMEKIKHLMWLYPALVMPLELREDSELIHLALSKKDCAINNMLKALKQISRGFDPKWYVRGFIVSMCQKPVDLDAAIKLLIKYLGEYLIPAVPLFENELGLTNSIKILEHNFKAHQLQKIHKQRWNNKYEIMIGYSDSSKENGVLPARILLEKSIHRVDEYLTSKRLQPVFFHGSGGSISRGGGSVSEQISWWPKSSLQIYKATIQGEAIQRHFANPLIARSQIAKITSEFENFAPREVSEKAILIKFSELIQCEYRQLVNAKEFHQMVFATTPYQFLNLLKLGSRPSKRTTNEFSLRAIPWILCWTQTRLLLPVWWGIGKSYKSLSKSDQTKLKQSFKANPLFSSFIKNLGFTLEKIELGVWLFLLDQSSLDDDQKIYWKNLISDELYLVKDFFHEITEGKELTWFRPWLKESIFFRSSMIHPLNVIQKIAKEREDARLLRLSVTGISCGLLTTG